MVVGRGFEEFFIIAAGQSGNYLEFCKLLDFGYECGNGTFVIFIKSDAGVVASESVEVSGVCLGFVGEERPYLELCKFIGFKYEQGDGTCVIFVELDVVGVVVGGGNIYFIGF